MYKRFREITSGTTSAALSSAKRPGFTRQMFERSLHGEGNSGSNSPRMKDEISKANREIRIKASSNQLSEF
jgi:hypothetical protein